MRHDVVAQVQAVLLFIYALAWWLYLTGALKEFVSYLHDEHYATGGYVDGGAVVLASCDIGVYRTIIINNTYEMAARTGVPPALLIENSWTDNLDNMVPIGYGYNGTWHVFKNDWPSDWEPLQQHDASDADRSTDERAYRSAKDEEAPPSSALH